MTLEDLTIYEVASGCWSLTFLQFRSHHPLLLALYVLKAVRVVAENAFGGYFTAGAGIAYEFVLVHV